MIDYESWTDSIASTKARSTPELGLVLFNANWRLPLCSAFEMELTAILQLIPELKTLQLYAPLIDCESNDTEITYDYSDKANKVFHKPTFMLLAEKYNLVDIPYAVWVNSRGESINFESAILEFPLKFRDALERLVKYVNHGQELFPPVATASNEINDKNKRQQAFKLFNLGDPQHALELLSDLLVRQPMDPIANYNMGIILHTVGMSRLAVKYLLQVVRSSPQDDNSQMVLTSVLYPLESSIVAAGYKTLVQLQPKNVRAAHFLAAIEGSAKSSSAEYVRGVFDCLAPTFEDKLVNHLQYRVPWDLFDLVNKIYEPLGTKSNVTIDLGCGTGLCGTLFRGLSKELVGADLSPVMIEKCDSLKIYDELRVQDVYECVSSFENGSIDLIIAADVWIYVGELDSIFEACAKVLPVGGIMAFSIELLDNITNRDKDHQFALSISGRFQHTESYIASLSKSNKFQEIVKEYTILRIESNEPINGQVYILQKQ